MKIRLTRAEYVAQTGCTPGPYSVGACMYRRVEGVDILLLEYIFTDGCEMDDLERIGRLVDPRDG